MARMGKKDKEKIVHYDSNEFVDSEFDEMIEKADFLSVGNKYVAHGNIRHKKHVKAYPSKIFDRLGEAIQFCIREGHFNHIVVYTQDGTVHVVCDNGDNSGMEARFTINKLTDYAKRLIKPNYGNKRYYQNIKSNEL